MQNLLAWLAKKLAPESLGASDRKALVDLLRIKARGAELSQTNFPVGQYPQAYGTFIGKQQAYAEAADLLEGN